MAATYQTLDNVFSDVRFNASKDSTTLSDAELLRLANKYYALLMRELIDLNEDLYAQISSTALVAGQREYPLPTDSTTTYGGGLVKLQRVEISYDGSSWRVADPISLQEISGPTILDADLNSEFDKGNPRYWFKDRSVWIAPVPGSDDSVAAQNTNLRIYWIQRVNELTATTDIPDLPKDFLSVLTEGILTDVFRMLGRTTDMSVAQRNFLVGIEKMRQLEAAPDSEQPFMFMHAKKNYK